MMASHERMKDERCQRYGLNFRVLSVKCHIKPRTLVEFAPCFSKYEYVYEYGGSSATRVQS
jgi:hypothetical protein